MRVEVDMDRLGIVLVEQVGADFLVGWIWFEAATIANGGGDNTRERGERALRVPES